MKKRKEKEENLETKLMLPIKLNTLKTLVIYVAETEDKLDTDKGNVNHKAHADDKEETKNNAIANLM